MSACPHCNKPLELNNAPVYNAKSYGRSVLAIALCCGKGVMLHPRVVIENAPYFGVETEDGWGNPIKPTAEETKLKYRG